MRRFCQFIFVLLLPAVIAVTVLQTNTTLRAGEEQFSEENINYDFALGLLKRGLYKEAAEEFDKFITRYPQSAKLNSALLNRAEALFSTQQFATAARDYYNYLKSSKNSEPAARLRYGICLYELKQYQDALNTLAPLIKDNEKISQSATYYTGLCQRQTGKTSQAQESLLKVNDSALRPLALYSLSEMLLELKNYKEAASYLSQIIEQYPDHHLSEKARLVRANALRLAGNLSASSGDFNQLLNSENPQLRIRARYGLAWTLFGDNNLSAARKQLLEILKDPGEFKDGSNYLLGSITFRQKDYPGAIKFFQLIKDGPFAPKASLATAWAYYNNKDYTTAINEINRCSKLYPDFSEQELHYLSGRCLWHLEKFIEAAGEFNYALKFKGSRNIQATFELALAYQRAGKFPEAAETFNHFIKNFPKEKKLILQAKEGLGSTLMSQGRYEAAVPVYINLQTLNAKDPTLQPKYLNLLAVCYYYLKQYQNMAQTYQRLLNQYQQSQYTPDALFWLGWQNNNSANYPAAIKFFKQLIKDYPKHNLTDRSKYFLGLTYLRSGNEKDAADIFYHIATTKNNGINEQELLWLAQYFSKENEFAKATAIYNLLLKNDNNSLIYVVALRGEAQIYQKQQLWQEALSSWEKLLASLTKTNGSSDVLNALGNESCHGCALCLRHLKKFAAAREYLAKIRIADDDPFVAKLYYERGLLDFAENNFKLSANNLMRVGLLVADEELAGSALLKAAEACEKLNDTAKAKICYQELAGVLEGSYGKIYPNNQYTKTGKEKLRALNAKTKETKANF